MADEKTGGAGGVLFGWAKAGVTSVLGLVGGACLMYFSPLIDKVIKPGKPVANFQAEADGLKVVFHNRSSNGNEGWWDFGDGSALEPYSAGKDVNHAYTHPGAYSVKLTLRSLFGEENDRTVTVSLDATAPSTAPLIETFDVKSLSGQRVYAPATFKVVSKVKNADLCVWALGNEQPIDVAADTSGQQERYVTFTKPGTHVLRLAAYAGATKQLVEKTQAVQIDPQPQGMVMAVLNVTHQVEYVRTRDVTHRVPVDFPPNEKGNTWKFQREVPAPVGFAITKAHLDTDPSKILNARGLSLEILPDRRKVRLAGELVKAAKGSTQWVAPLVLTVEQRMPPQTRPMGEVNVPLQVPGTTLLPMPMPQGGWVSQRRSLKLELREGATILWQTTQTPWSGDFLLRGQRYRMTVTEVVGNQVSIVIQQGLGSTPVGN
jgi:hypothetical protein